MNIFSMVVFCINGMSGKFSYCEHIIVPGFCVFRWYDRASLVVVNILSLLAFL